MKTPGAEVLDLRTALEGWTTEERTSRAHDVRRDFVTRGSNNWAVGADRTTHSAAILATPPYLATFKRKRHSIPAHIKRDINISVQMKSDEKRHTLQSASIKYLIETLLIGRLKRGKRIFAFQRTAICT